MSFPWGQTTLPVTFACPHCGQILEQLGKKVTVCDCPASEQAEQTAREAAKTWTTARQERRPTFDEMRERQKVARREKNG